MERNDKARDYLGVQIEQSGRKNDGHDLLWKMKDTNTAQAQFHLPGFLNLQIIQPLFKVPPTPISD